MYKYLNQLREGKTYMVIDCAKPYVNMKKGSVFKVIRYGSFTFNGEYFHRTLRISKKIGKRGYKITNYMLSEVAKRRFIFLELTEKLKEKIDLENI